MPPSLRLEKAIETTIHVANPIHFAANKDEILMATIRDRYARRCFKGAFILGVKGVAAASAVRLTRTNLSAEGEVDVRFLAEVAVFSAWDILVGVRIVSRQQMLVGDYAAPGEGGARAVVCLLADKAAETLAVGQLVAVRVIAAKYPAFQERASVVGTLLVCDKSAPAFRLRGTLDGAARAELAPILSAIGSELEARAALPPASVAFFEGLLYAYRRASRPPPEGAAGANASGKGGTAPLRLPREGDIKGELASEGGLNRGETALPPPLNASLRVPSWEGGPDWTGPPASRPPPPELTRNVLSIARRAAAGESVPVSGVWSRPLGLFRSSPLACCAADGKAPADWAEPADSTPRVAFAELLRNILDFLVAVRELAETFAQRELLEAHEGVWAAMRAQQAA